MQGDQLCLFTAEADVEEEVKISNKVLRSMGRVTVHSDIQVEAGIYTNNIKNNFQGLSPVRHEEVGV